MGKQEYKFSDHVRFGALPKVERKVITKMSNRGALRGLEHTSVCTSEIGAMLTCFEAVRARACAIAGRCAGCCARARATSSALFASPARRRLGARPTACRPLRP
jgi:hypothetical protein